MWWSLEYGEVARAERHEGAEVPGAGQEEQAFAVREGAEQECAVPRAVAPQACVSGLLWERRELHVEREVEAGHQVTRMEVRTGMEERGSVVGQQEAPGVAFGGAQAVARAEARYVAQIEVR